jgi:hypothetical protein
LHGYPAAGFCFCAGSDFDFRVFSRDYARDFDFAAWFFDRSEFV